MNVIPVIDIRGGEVVHAVGGRRDEYRPIVTPLADGADPVAVACGFRRLYSFPDLYIADLDGIERGAPDLATVRDVADAEPGATIWVDNGAASATAVRRLLAIDGTVAVIGSETLRDASELTAANREGPGRIALSLDFTREGFAGSPELLARVDMWPERVIVMTLAKVGADAGPDLERVAGIKARAGAGRRVYAAGGVRDVADVEALARIGAAGVLVASALHAGKIKAGDLGKITGL